jgi:serine/threonine-protein kinase
VNRGRPGRRRRTVTDAPTEPLAPVGTVTEEYETVDERPVPPPPPEPPPRAWYDEIGWALLALLLLVAIGFAIWWFGFHNKGAAKRTVPEVTGRPVAVAVNTLQDHGFKARIASRLHPGRAGIVFSQIPSAGTRLKKGSTIQLLESLGPGTVAVPNAVGLTVAAGRDRLVKAGFKVTETRVFSNEKAGTVIDQSPAAGSKIAKGATVQVKVSKGTGMVLVPNVVGQSVGDAMTALAKAGLKGVVQLHVPSAQPAGTVVAQNPPGGQAKRGSTVRLNASTGTASNGSGSGGSGGTTGVTGPTGATGSSGTG